MQTQLQERLFPLKGKWQQVARVAGVSPQTIYRIAWGEQRDHKLNTFKRISEAIDAVSLELKK